MKGALSILHVNGVIMGFISAQAERAGSEITRIDPAADSRAGQPPAGKHDLRNACVRCAYTHT